MAGYWLLTGKRYAGMVARKPSGRAAGLHAVMTGRMAGGIAIPGRTGRLHGLQARERSDRLPRRRCDDMDGQTARLSGDAARWASEQVERGHFASIDDVVEAAMAFYRDEMEAGPEIDWNKAEALAAEGRAQVARGEYIEFADANAMDAWLDGIAQSIRDDHGA
jgi:Arc/MetJ-type ribon-helix-helix transcriptional regulator